MDTVVLALVVLEVVEGVVVEWEVTAWMPQTTYDPQHMAQHDPMHPIFSKTGCGYMAPCTHFFLK